MFGQIPGADKAIESAATHGYEAIVVVIVLLTLLGAVGWLMRALWSINQRLADRVTSLEGKIEDRLMTIVENTSAQLASNNVVMEKTIGAINNLEKAVEESVRDQRRIMLRIENSPCVAAAIFSEETKARLKTASELEEKSP